MALLATSVHALMVVILFSEAGWGVPAAAHVRVLAGTWYSSCCPSGSRGFNPRRHQTHKSTCAPPCCTFSIDSAVLIRGACATTRTRTLPPPEDRQRARAPAEEPPLATRATSPPEVASIVAHRGA